MVPGGPFWNIAASPPWPWRPLSVREQALAPSLLSLSVAYLRFRGHLVVLKTRQPIAVSDISSYICLIDIRGKSKEQLNERRAGLSTKTPPQNIRCKKSFVRIFPSSSFSLSRKCSPFHRCRRPQFFCEEHTEVLPPWLPTSCNCSLSPPLSQFEQCLLESGNHSKDHS